MRITQRDKNENVEKYVETKESRCKSIREEKNLFNVTLGANSI